MRSVSCTAGFDIQSQLVQHLISAPVRSAFTSLNFARILIPDGSRELKKTVMERRSTMLHPYLIIGYKNLLFVRITEIGTIMLAVFAGNRPYPLNTKLAT